MVLGWRFLSGALSILFLASFGSASAQGQDVQVTLGVYGTSGEPGEEVAVQLRGSTTIPLAAIILRFDFPRAAGTYTGVGVEGTASAHVMPRGIVYYPEFIDRDQPACHLAGLRFDAQGQRAAVGPGEDLVFFNVLVLISPDAVPGDYVLKVLSADLSSVGGTLGPVPSITASEALITVKAPTRPRPISGFVCGQVHESVLLSWSPTEAYDGISITRGGRLLADVPGTATSYEDAPPLGLAEYAVTARREGKESFPARCSALVQTPRALAVSELTCAPSGGATLLSWTNNAPYDSIKVLRNGQALAELDGSVQSYSDPWSSSLFTVYTVQGSVGSVDTAPSSCRLNESSDVVVFWAEEVRAEPGASGIPIRIFITNPFALHGVQVALRIDPAFVRIQRLSVGPAAEAAQYDTFMYQGQRSPDILATGETVAGITFTMLPLDFPFPPQADAHLLTVVVDVPPIAHSGVNVPLEFGTFGSPKLGSLCAVEGFSRPVQTRNGAILIGESPVPEVRDFEGGIVDGGGAGADLEPDAIAMSWKNSSAYSAIRIERDATTIAELAGDSTSFVDPGPGPGVHRYRLIARQGTMESFPAVYVTYPRRVPGTFVRGDANSDGAIDIGDAVKILEYLFRAGSQPACLDAADADDNGELDVTDPISVLGRLFLGACSLPPPGPDVAWFDPTDDGLSCN